MLPCPREVLRGLYLVMWISMTPRLALCDVLFFRALSRGALRGPQPSTVGQRETRVHTQVYIRKCAYLRRDRQPRGSKDSLLERHVEKQT